MAAIKNTQTGICSEGAVSLDVAAKRIGVSIRTLYKEMDDGRIGYTRGGRIRKIPILEIERYLESRYVPPTND